MKSIAASIIVLSGAYLIGTGPQVRQDWITLIGAGVGLVGFGLLFATWKDKSN